MSKSILIGYINETGREITRCPGYYAADWEKLQLKPGRYEIRVTVEGGYTCPMPYWLVAGIDARRVEGKTYSGFGGVNYSSRDLPVEDVTYNFQTYAYHLQKLVDEGMVELLPGFELLAEDKIAFGKSLEWGKGLLANN